MLRTHTCGELDKKHAGKGVVLCGWVDSIRVHGKIGFINIKDKYGVTQLFLNENTSKKAASIKKESVIVVNGKVKARPDKLINKEMATGEIEVVVSDIAVLNESEPLPIDLDKVKSTEETRSKYRYLDLRRPAMQKKILIRHKVIKAIRDFFDKEGFLEIETPILAKSTPEGARDYVVPSRIYPKSFFALPQSPQLFKQLLMIACFDKYFQIAKCFRDEDLRADRQPEFTQLDLEMSFITEDDIYDIMERMFKYVWKVVLNKDIKIPFPRMTYDEAMKKYKTDAPDTKGKEGFRFIWVTDFPMFEYSKEEKRYKTMHHPFTSPKGGLDFKNPEKMKSRSYDLVLNGVEIGGGSIRIHKPEIQKKIFEFLKISDKEAKEKFGFLVEALKHGAPPHGGIAFGLDRIIAIITGDDSIREVIAFPKNKDTRDLMLNAPSQISAEQIKELGLK